MLKRCVTSIYLSDRVVAALPNRGYLGKLGRLIKKKMSNRMCSELNGVVHQWPLPEVIHLFFSRLGIGKANAWILWRNRIFGRWGAQNVLNDVDIVWGFDTSSLEIFKEARKRGILCVLDMSIVHPSKGEQILNEHASYRPEYASELDGDKKTKQEVANRTAELDLANVIVSTSNFVKCSLNEFGFESENIIVNPPGVDVELFAPEYQKENFNPVVFLFVGWFSQRKGIYYLLEAWEQASLKSKAELWLAGGAIRQLKSWQGHLPGNIRILGRVPHFQLAEIYKQAHVFVFPSLLEGFAKVILEAMASGLPVIGTDYILEEIVDSGVHGLWVGAGNVHELASAMEKFAKKTPLIKKMGKAARQRAEQYTWKAYGDRCASICQSLFDNISKRESI